MRIGETADRIARAAEALGYNLRNMRHAQTGTCYLSCAAPDEVDEIVIRVADHSDAYARADYTADGIEGSAQGAVAFLAARVGKPIPPAWRAAETRARNRAAALDAQRAHADAQRAAEGAALRAAWDALLSRARAAGSDLPDALAAAEDQCGKTARRRRTALRRALEKQFGR